MGLDGTAADLTHELKKNNMNVQSALTAFRSAVVSLIRYMARLLVVSVLMLVGLVGLLIVYSISGVVHERFLTISPNVQAVVIPLTALSIFFLCLLFQYSKGHQAGFPLENGIIVFVHPLKWGAWGQSKGYAGLDQRVGLRTA